MNLKNLIFGIAIFILTLFVTIYGTSVFLPQPEYTDFCPEVRAAVVVDNAQMCESMDGKWTDYNFVETPKPDTATGYCDLNYYCRQDYEKSLEENSKKRFLVSIPLGIIVLGLGALGFAIESVGIGLMAGGAGTFVWGSGSYWGYASDLWRFVISLVGLVILIGFVYWFEKRNKKKGFLKKFLGKKR